MTSAVTAKLPAPLNSKTCDCRGLPWMPLYGDRLFNSAFDAAVSDSEFRAALLLWWRAFQSVPAGSLADDDFELAKAAGFGRDLEKWFGVKHAALHNFVRCRDGRLYHPVVCEIAMMASKRRTNGLKRWKKFRAVPDGQPTRCTRANALPTRCQRVYRTRQQRRGRTHERTRERESSRRKKEYPPL